jgi:AsmA protein
MSRTLRLILIVVGLLIVIVIAAPFLIPVNQFRPTIEEKASAALGRKVEVGDLSLSLFSGSLAADNLSIADDPKFNKSPFLTAKSINVGVELMPLILSKELNITGIIIDNPEVTLIRSSGGEWNYSSFGVAGKSRGKQERPAQPPGKLPSAGNEFSVQKLALNNGRINIGSTSSSKRSVYDKVDLTASDVSLNSKFPVTLTASLPGGGNLKLEGTAGPLDQENTALTPVNAKLTINGLNLAATGFLDPAAGLGGLLDLNANIASQNAEARVSGAAKLSKALFVAGGSPASTPVNVDFNTKYDLRKNSGVLEPSTLKIGNAVGHLNGTYEVPADATVVHIKVDAQNMPARDLQAFLPALGINLPKGASLAAGSLSANLTASGPVDKLITTGTVGLYSAKLAGFDLGSRMSTISALTGLKTGQDLDIEKVASNVRMAPDGIQADNFNAVVPALGTLVGGGTIDSKNSLDFKMAATLANSATFSSSNGGPVSGIGGILGAIGGGKGGCKGATIPFQIHGTTADPKFVPDIGGIAASMLKTQLGCAGTSAGASQLQQLQQQNPDNPIDAISGLFKKKKP